MSVCCEGNESRVLCWWFRCVKWNFSVAASDWFNWYTWEWLSLSSVCEPFLIKITNDEHIYMHVYGNFVKCVFVLQWNIIREKQLLLVDCSRLVIVVVNHSLYRWSACVVLVCLFFPLVLPANCEPPVLMLQLAALNVSLHRKKAYQPRVTCNQGQFPTSQLSGCCIALVRLKLHWFFSWITDKWHPQRVKERHPGGGGGMKYFRFSETWFVFVDERTGN